MGYVPLQRWTQTYSLDRGLDRGTIFPDLDLPFGTGRSRR
ncbi:MAG: spore coat associated protein CotJA [Clostridiales bacterium]|nr:spore coat associated protein CotJA [Clostridiales bacterium]